MAISISPLSSSSAPSSLSSINGGATPATKNLASKNLSQAQSQQSSPQKRAHLSDNPASDATSAERDAAARISIAAGRVTQAQQQSEQALHDIHDQYNRTSEIEEERHESALEVQRNKGYEQIRELRRTQNAELQRIQQARETQLNQLRDHYRTAVASASRQESEQLQAMKADQQRYLQSEIRHADNQNEAQREKNTEALEILRYEGEKRAQDLSTANNKNYEKLKEQYTEAAQQTQDHFQERTNQTHRSFDDTFHRLETQANEELHRLRTDTAQKLSAYAARQNDPFYKMKTIGGQLEENEDSFTLSFKIPDYEQGHISASIKGDNLLISGYRRNEEELKTKEGHTQGSASFESFHESFPLSWPVDSSRLTKDYDGDTMVIRVPKKNEHVFRSPQKEKPAPIQAERPHFPENISKTGYKKPNEIKGKGSGTLI